MPKERGFNPVQAQRKADKAKAIKKGKAEVTNRRNERLAKRNPEKIRQQIEELKAITLGGGKLTRHEEQVLEGLEKEFKAVTKARDTVGDKAPTFRSSGLRDGRDGGVLGKRRRDAEDASSSGSDVPDDVKKIPMPRDTPPPIPKETLDKWYAKRRARRNTNPNQEPLGERRDRGENGDEPPKAEPVVEAKTVYEAKPAMRDLRKEAVSAFVPTAVRVKIDKGKGRGGLLDPEEADQLEREGYLKSSADNDLTDSSKSGYIQPTGSRHVTMEEIDDEEG